MNGMHLWEMDNIIYPACRRCRDHERAGFAEGIKLGILLFSELAEKWNYSAIPIGVVLCFYGVKFDTCKVNISKL